MGGRGGLIVEVIYGPAFGGSEMLALALVRRWRAQGRDCRVCCLYERGGALTRVFEEEGIPYDLLDIGPLSFARRFIKLFRYFRSLKPRAVHVHHLGMLMNVLPAAHLAGCRTVVCTEHSRSSLSRVPGLAWLAPVLSRATHRLVSVSSALDGTFRELGVPDRKRATVYNGVDTDHFFPPARRDPAGPLRLGAVGRLVDEKDYPNLFAAMSALRCAGVPLELHVVGGGPLAPALVAEFRARALEDAVVLHGDRKDVAAFLRTLDLYVLSSKSEGLPMALLEAMATGLPIVATRVGGIPEVIEDGVSGLLVPPADPDALAAALARLSADTTLRVHLGRNALARARADFSIDGVARRYAAHLRLPEILEGAL